MARVRSFLFSFQSKLMLSLTAVMALSILLAGAVFVARTRDERRTQALERVAAASPAIYQQAFVALLPDNEEDDEEHTFAETLDELADDQDARILVIAPDGTILHDTGGRVTGEHLSIPQSSFEDVQRGFIAWEPEPGFPEDNITFVSASSRIVTRHGSELPFRIVLAVESDNIADAWLGVLPGLGLAALVAIPISVLASILLARQVAHPVRRLTAASEAMARGDFSQRVEVGRDDEIGRLARSFSTMSQRVGQRDAQMRALLANVSHDLKTPMTSITGYATSLTDGTAPAADVARIGNVIRDEALHVNALLADLLYLGEIDAGQLVAAHEDVPLADVVTRCVRRIEPQAREKDIDLTADVSGDLVLRRVDPDKVERAMTNVLENAAKFTPPGGQIAVRASKNGAGVQCEVSNTGSHIEEEDLPRLFDRFFRGDRARRTSGGSGLGLAIARELVEMNGGHIAARNDASGVTIALTLPGVNTT